MNNENLKIQITHEECFISIGHDRPNKVIYSLFEKEGKWILRTKEYYFLQNPKKRAITLDANEVNPNDFIKSLSKVQITVFPEEIFGLDGSFTELEIYNGLSSMKLKWWSQSPRKWIKLKELTMQFIEKMDAFLLQDKKRPLSQ